MEARSFQELLKKNSYPGRGVMMGMTPDGTKLAAAYFIMGRSENSRNRIFVKEGEGIRTQACDPKKLVDPSLIIYSPVKVLGDYLIVTNGDQTDTIYEGLQKGVPADRALSERCCEPDAPNFTPRISGVASFGEKKASYEISILKKQSENSDCCSRYFYRYGTVKGEGHLIHTYECDGEVLPSFAGEPKKVKVLQNMEEMAGAIWDSLDAENRISLYVRYTDLKTREYTEKIINRYGQEVHS